MSEIAELHARLQADTINAKEVGLREHGRTHALGMRVTAMRGGAPVALVTSSLGDGIKLLVRVAGAYFADALLVAADTASIDDDRQEHWPAREPSPLEAIEMISLMATRERHSTITYSIDGERVDWRGEPVSATGLYPALRDSARESLREDTSAARELMRVAQVSAEISDVEALAHRDFGIGRALRSVAGDSVRTRVLASALQSERLALIEEIRAARGEQDA